MISATSLQACNENAIVRNAYPRISKCLSIMFKKACAQWSNILPFMSGEGHTTGSKLTFNYKFHILYMLLSIHRKFDNYSVTYPVDEAANNSLQWQSCSYSDLIKAIGSIEKILIYTLCHAYSNRHDARIQGVEITVSRHFTFWYTDSQGCNIFREIFAPEDVAVNNRKVLWGVSERNRENKSTVYWRNTVLLAIWGSTFIGSGGTEGGLMRRLTGLQWITFDLLTMRKCVLRSECGSQHCNFRWSIV